MPFKNIHLSAFKNIVHVQTAPIGHENEIIRIEVCHRELYANVLKYGTEIHFAVINESVITSECIPQTNLVVFAKAYQIISVKKR